MSYLYSKKYFKKKFFIILSFVFFSIPLNFIFAYEISGSQDNKVSPWSIWSPSELIKYITEDALDDSGASESAKASKSAQEQLSISQGLWEKAKIVWGFFRELFYMTIAFISQTLKMVINLIRELR